MKYRFRVHHSAEHDKFAASQNLTPKDEQHEYESFPGAISHMFDHPNISAISEPAPPGTKGVVVTLDTKLPKEAAEAALVELVNRLNERASALCLVIDEL